MPLPVLVGQESKFEISEWGWDNHNVALFPLKDHDYYIVICN